MKTPHTAGPYTTSGITGDNHIMVRGRTIAIVPGWPTLTSEEHAANMELLRSAPTLLAERNELREALNGVIIPLERLIEGSEGTVKETVQARLKAVRATLSKSTK